MAWRSLHEASLEWYQRNKTRLHTPLKRSQSQILDLDQPWGDFSKIKPGELDRIHISRDVGIVGSRSGRDEAI